MPGPIDAAHAEILEWIRSKPRLRQIPVIIISSSDEKEDIQRCYELGSSSYLVKPLGYDHLLEMVKAIRLYWVTLNQWPG